MNIDIVDRLRFDAARCEATFSKGVARNIEEAAAEIERLTAERDRLLADHEALFAERERLRTALLEARPYVPEHHGPVQAKIREALAPLHQQKTP